MTAERSPQGPVTHHLLPSSPRAPAVSSVPVLPKHLCGAGQAGCSQVHPKGFGNKGAPEPVTPWGTTQREQQPASAQHAGARQFLQGVGVVKPTYIKVGRAALRCESLAQPPRLHLHSCRSLPVPEMLHLRLGLPGRSRRGCWGKPATPLG